MNLKVPGEMLLLGYMFLSTGAKTVWEVVATTFGELGLNENVCFFNLFICLFGFVCFLLLLLLLEIKNDFI